MSGKKPFRFRDRWSLFGSWVGEEDIPALENRDRELESHLDTVEVRSVTPVTGSTERPVDPVEGEVIYEEDTDALLIYDGTEWTPPKDVAWGISEEGDASSSVGVYTLTSGNAATWTQSVTLRSDRKYLITASITGIPSDTTESGGVNEMTRMQMTASYNSATFDQVRFGYAEYYWSDDASPPAHTNANPTYLTTPMPAVGLVTGSGSAANVTFTFSDSINRGYDFDVYSDYSRFVITDVGPA